MQYIVVLVKQLALHQCHVIPLTAIRDLQIGGQGRLPIRVSHSEHAHLEKNRPPNLMRMLSEENYYSLSSSDLKVPIVWGGKTVAG